MKSDTWTSFLAGIKGGCRSKINGGVFCPAKDIINTYTVKICQDQQYIRWRDAVAGFIFGEQGLFDAGFHLQADLCQSMFLAQFSKIVFHLYHQ